MLAHFLKNRLFFHSILRTARRLQRPLKGKDGYLRHLPDLLLKGQNFKEIPALADTPFRDTFKNVKKRISNPESTVAIFTGCLQDFVYPQHLLAGMKLLQELNIDVDLPKSQGCCGHPAHLTSRRTIQGFSKEEPIASSSQKYRQK